MLVFRRRLLPEPLGLDFTAAEFKEEERQIHLGLYRDNALAGTVLLVRPDTRGAGKLRQMAVEPALQGRGLGAQLVGRGEEVLCGLGAATIALSARVTAGGFYRRLGYAVVGEAFVEVTIPHVRMEKQVGPSNGAT